MGFEPTTSSLEVRPFRTPSSSKTSESRPLKPPGVVTECSEESDGSIPDADLARLIAAWPTLPEPIKAAIRALLGTIIPRTGG
jgi:hypothetical protein